MSGLIACIDPSCIPIAFDDWLASSARFQSIQLFIWTHFSFVFFPGINGIKWVTVASLKVEW